ncbi:nuclear transport factor 2 family protein [Paraburkholderia sp. FT54]|uniref:nuclear transport factor 2 family protein n=1 Tax=Paraburkholderia sp. FT54 TaxID=3074437 RepID=UPI0028780E9B|nr:nuclear transport factor 2 family protein [Paraburkholderia sp. FT54]WNC90313.1 nuclear transport factor 2 family protein [Paraburkholderia sp. FT54]
MATAQTNDEQALASLEQQWAKAWLTGDRVALNKILDDSYVETTARGAQLHKTDVIFAAPPPGTASEVLESIEPRVNGDTAIVTGIGRYIESLGSKPARFKFTDVFVRRDGTWRVIASSTLLLDQ